MTDAVHERGSYIYLQIFAVGRAAIESSLKEEDPSFSVVSASDIPLTGNTTPVPLTIPEIKEYVKYFATAAENGVHKAGFDGIEVHAANGYLMDQFIQDVSNKRTDEYGGSIENRSRFILEVIDAVVEKVGAKKTGFRISPWGLFQGEKTKFTVHPRDIFLLKLPQICIWTIPYLHSPT